MSMAAIVLCAGTAAAQPMTQQQVERRFQVRLFGSALVNAAQHGAALMGMKVQQIDPNIILLSGTAPRAQGFVIDGHGVFFHVEIPNVDPYVARVVSNNGRDQVAMAALNRMKSLLPLVTDPVERQSLEANIRSLEFRLLPPGSQQNRAMQTGVAGFAAPAPSAPAPIMSNPHLEYEKLVTEQLVNAMLDHSSQLGLGADEWLTVAARGSQGSLIPEAVVDDSVTLMLRIKGSDLADLRAGRITREEARARVVVREF